VKPVRSLVSPALKVADRRCLKTILPLDPGRKGAPYTGLKPAGRSEGPVIPLAELAVEMESDSHHVYEAITAEGHAKHSDPLG